MANQKPEIARLSDGTWCLVWPGRRRFASKQECEWQICLVNCLSRAPVKTQSEWEKKLASIASGARKRMPTGQPFSNRKVRKAQSWEQSIRTAFSKLLKEIRRSKVCDEWEKCIDSKRSALEKRSRFHNHKNPAGPT